MQGNKIAPLADTEASNKLDKLVFSFICNVNE